MNKHEEARMIVEYENANQDVFTEKQMDILRNYFTQSEATEKELEEEKKQHQYDNKYMNEVVKGLTDKTLEVVKRKRDYEIQRANEFDNSMFPPNFYWEHQGAVNVLNSIIAEIEGDK